MRNWFSTLRRQFAAWRERNALAHANAPSSPCCSAPPAGAGEHRDKHKSH